MKLGSPVNSGWNKVVWALDPMEQVVRAHEKAIEMVRELVKQGIQVQPIYLMSPFSQSDFNFPFELSAAWPTLIDEFVPGAEKLISEKLRSYLVEGVLPPKIISQVATSMTHTVDTLTQASIDLGADVILATTHGRSGFRRFISGSFTETLMARSALPVVVLGPHIKKSVKIEMPKKILFASDLSEESKEVFRRVLSMAKFMGAEVTVFHTLALSFEPVFQSGVFLLGGGWVPIQANFGEELQRQERRAHAWARWGNTQGVKVSYWISMESRSVSESLLKATEDSNYSMIAIEAQSGAFSATLLGSITRQVVRHSPCPVWVLPARALSTGAIGRRRDLKAA
jgi:nucleotide-binding universal stress UspA family protein